MDYDAFWQQVSTQRRGRGHGLAVFRRVPSSHEIGRRLVREYSDEGATLPTFDLVAWEQLAGQGRDGREWSSPAGAGAWVSLVRPGLQGPLQRLPLLVGVALVEGLGPWLGSRLRLKWPNDLVISAGAESVRPGAGPRWRKLGGILISMATSGEPGNPAGNAVISFGINHARDPAIFGQPRATSLLAHFSAIEKPGPTLAELVTTTLDAVDRRLGLLPGGPSEDPTPGARSPAGLAAEDLLDRYRASSLHRPGDPLTCRVGDEAVSGTFLGFDENGFLRLDDGAAERRLGAGDLVDPLAPPTAAADDPA